MDIKVLNYADAVAKESACWIAALARRIVSERGKFIMALSGGKTPWQMLRVLAREDVPWENVHIVQVDERVAPDGHPDRNLTHLRESLLAHTPMREKHIYAMPVEAKDLEEAAKRYALQLSTIAGAPPVLDLVHLGLGVDGHTASLFPGDPGLHVSDADVAITGLYHGRQRMTLTFPLINRARNILWIVTGADKAPMMQQLEIADDSIPAGQINRQNALVFADRDAMGGIIL
jgi:6-phosphogluconolactonase